MKGLPGSEKYNNGSAFVRKEQWHPFQGNLVWMEGMNCWSDWDRNIQATKVLIYSSFQRALYIIDIDFFWKMLFDTFDLFLIFCISVFMYFCLFILPFFCLSFFCLSMFLSFCLSVFLSFYLCVFLSFHPFILFSAFLCCGLFIFHFKRLPSQTDQEQTCSRITRMVICSSVTMPKVAQNSGKWSLPAP